MRRIQMLTAGLLAVCLLFSGCAASNAAGKEKEELPEMKETVFAPEPLSLPGDPAEGARSFALSLLKTAAEQEQGNFVISPLSAYLALAMAAAGADNDTLRELEQVLGGTAQGLLTYSSEQAERLSVSTPDATVALANSLWLDERLDVDPDFLDTLTRQFRADATQAPLGSADTMNAINQWVERNTHGMIPNFLEQPLDADAAMALINALYFNCKWAEEFPSRNTMELPFYLDGGAAVQVNTMCLTGNLRAAILPDGAKAVCLSYRETGVQFVAVLPPEGVSARDYAAGLTEETLRTCLNAETKYVRLHLPRFSMESGGELKPLLQRMGITLAFREDADFSGMTADPGTELYIGSVLQKTRIKVGEKGTEAAASTMVEMLYKGVAIPKHEPLDLFFDRSFLFFLADQESEMPLFSGIVSEPKE